jgi:hypothetical protein
LLQTVVQLPRIPAGDASYRSTSGQLQVSDQRPSSQQNFIARTLSAAIRTLCQVCSPADPIVYDEFLGSIHDDNFVGVICYLKVRVCNDKGH